LSRAGGSRGLGSGRSGLLRGSLPVSLLLGLILAAGPAWAGAQAKRDQGTEVWRPLIKRLVADGQQPALVQALFARPEAAYDPVPMKIKIAELHQTVFGPERVRPIQEGLVRLGFLPGPVDGRYGPRTARAISSFQKKYGLKPHGLPYEETLREILKRLEERFKVKVEPPPATREVYRHSLTESQLAQTRLYGAEHRQLLERVETEYGVPGEIALGILTVETRLGAELGRRPAFITLASMSLGAGPGPVRSRFKDLKLNKSERDWLDNQVRQKADWAYSELKALLAYAQANGHDPLALPGSIYGAIGISQFMPSNALKYGQDGNGDGRVDLFQPADAVLSLAKYLKVHGWGENLGREDQRRVLYAYNRSDTYVNTVLAVADRLQEDRTKGTDKRKSSL